MPEPKPNSKARRPRYFAVVLAFVFTSIAHAAIIFASARILEGAGAIGWTLEWRESAALGLMAVTWRMWLRNGKG